MLYRPEGWLPEGLLERVAAALTERLPPALVEIAHNPDLPSLDTGETKTAFESSVSSSPAKGKGPSTPMRPAHPTKGSRAATAALEAALPPQRRRPMLPAGEKGSVGRLLWFCMQAAQRSYESSYASSTRFPAAATGTATGPAAPGNTGVEQPVVDHGLLVDMLDS